MIMALRATLEEALEAYLIIHVIDASSPNYKAQREDVLNVLHELGLQKIEYEPNYIEVFNKIDLLDEAARENLLARLGGGAVAEWLADRLEGIVGALGFEPADLRLKKPVLTNSSNVLEAGGAGSVADVQDKLRDLPIGTTDPDALLRALGYQAGEQILATEVTLAEILIPGLGSVPLTVRLRDIAGAGSRR